jgi:tRNA threonylcarbamoyladenosine biosynthesis protein TsaB
MALILNIDTATEIASICLAQNGEPLVVMHNHMLQDHASWLHEAIKKMIIQANLGFKDLNAVAVTAGPGSYTGLRVGMATAKGFCYALDIPLITENTLYVMAFAAIQQIKQSNLLFCPMIDARRMEVFTALYSVELEEIIPPSAIVLQERSFAADLSASGIFFFGSGSTKWQTLTSNANAIFASFSTDSRYLSLLSHQKFEQKKFTDIIYCEPVYIKEFHSYTKK